MGIMGIAEIMDRSIDILKKYIKTIVLFALAYGIITIFMYIAFVIAITVLGVLAVNISNPGNFFLPAIVISAVIVTAVAFSLSSSIGYIKITSQEFFEERVYASDAIKASFKGFPKVLGIVVSLLVLFIPVALVIAAAGYFLYQGFMSSLIDIGYFGLDEIMLIILSILAALAAVLAVIGYISIFSFSIYASSIENKGVIDSIKRSYTLVRHNFWRIFGCIILFYLTVYAILTSIEGFVALIAGLIFAIMKLLNVQQDVMTFISSVSSSVQGPLQLLSSLIISPIGSIMLSLLYFNQRFKKEGYDIVLNLKQMQKNNEGKRLSEGIEFNNSL